MECEMETERLDKIWGNFIFWPLESRKITARHNLRLSTITVYYSTLLSKQKKISTHFETAQITTNTIFHFLIRKTEVKAKHPPL